MAAMKPVTISNIGGTPNITKIDISGFLIDGLDEERFAEKIKFLL